MIAYGSLYPWQFIFDVPGNPLWILLNSWHAPDPRDFPARDLTVNLALYVPLGISGYLALSRRRRVVATALPIAIAATLSSGVEMLQIYYPLRYCSAVDVVANVLGASSGVAVARVFRKTFQVFEARWQFRGSPAPAPVPVLMLFVWTAYLLFPFFPVLSRTGLAEKLTLFTNDLSRPTAMIAGAITFLAIGRLLTAASVSAPGAWLWAAALLIPVQIVIVTRQPAAAYFLGALFGCVCFAILRKRIRAQQVACWAFLGLVIIRGLSPLTLQPGMNQFNWIPFAGLIEAEDGQHGMLIVLEKVCYYGTAIWAMHSAGLRLRTATLLAAATLACIEVIQVRLPGRTPDTTDPLIAAMLGVAFRAVERERKPARHAVFIESPR